MQKTTNLTCAGILILFFLLPLISTAQTLTGTWKGHIDIMGQSLSIITHFQKNDSSYSGTIDIPQQGATGLNLQKLSRPKKDSVSFGFPAGPGYASFAGTFENDSTITGIFTQNSQQFPFELTRTSQTGSKTVSNKQNNLPYNHEDLIIKNDSIKIGGTLTWPENKSSNNLVILISGSGAQNRDVSLKPLTSFEPFAKLAKKLTKNGIATFRYDDRGMGTSTGNFSQTTLDMLASDVEAIIHHFSQPSAGHHFQNIILLGHSQGGIIAGKVAAQSTHIDKLILMASTGVPLKQVSDFQVRQALARAGFSKEQIKTEMAARHQLYKAIQKQQNVEEAKKNHTSQFLELLQSIEGNQQSAKVLRQKAQQETNGLVAGYTNPQFLSLYSYNPTVDLKKLDVPVLVLFGGKDTQVPVKMNRPPIKEALESAGIPYQMNVFDRANHLFQKAKTGQVQEYGKLDSEFVDGLVPTLTEWIK